MPALGEPHRGLRQRRCGCAGGLGWDQAAAMEGSDWLWGTTMLLLALVLCRFALRTWDLERGAAWIPWQGAAWQMSARGLPVHETPVGSKPGGLCS